jgi:hypothetical protein
MSVTGPESDGARRVDVSPGWGAKRVESKSENHRILYALSQIRFQHIVKIIIFIINILNILIKLISDTIANQSLPAMAMIGHGRSTHRVHYFGCREGAQPPPMS